MNAAASPVPNDPPSSGAVVRASYQKGEVLRAGNQAFRVTRCLGLGAMGEVYEVEDQNLGVTRVMKLLRSELAQSRPHLVDRFLRESRCLAKLRHPSVVTVAMADRLPDGTPFYLMEFVAGRSLAAFLAKKAPLEAYVALPLLLQLASALDAVHAAGIVHRDIKADNVLIWREREGLRATLLDFGVMKLVADEVPEGFCGTPRFAAPEQLLGERATVKFDIFALGVIAFQMLSRRDPYEDYDNPRQRIERPAPLLSETPGAKSVSADLTMLVADMLSLDPTKRPTARQVGDRLVAIHEASHPNESRKLDENEITNEELMSISPLQATPIHPADLDAHTMPGSPPPEVLEAARRALSPTVRGQTVQGVGLGFEDGMVAAVAETELAGLAAGGNDFDIHAHALVIAQRAAAARMAPTRSIAESGVPKASTEPLPDDPPRPRDSELLQGLASQWHEKVGSSPGVKLGGKSDTKESAGPIPKLLVPSPAGPGATLPMQQRPAPGGKGGTVPLSGAYGAGAKSASGVRRATTPSETAEAVRLGREAYYAATEKSNARNRVLMALGGVVLAAVVLAIVALVSLRGAR